MTFFCAILVSENIRLARTAARDVSREGKSMSKSRRIIGICLNLAVAFMAIHGIALMMHRGWAILRFYTVLSNLLAAVACLLCAGCFFFGTEAPGWIRYLKLAATLGLTLTFLIAAAVLAPDMGFYEIFLEGAVLYHHLLCPVLCIISFLLFDRISVSPLTGAVITAVPTVIYGIVAYILNITRVMTGPYPFLQVYDQSVAATILWIIGLIVLVNLLGFLLVWLNRRIHKTAD